MTITNYGELKTAIADYLDRDDLTDQIPTFISLAEDRIAQETRLRIRPMETSTALTVATQTVALPTGYLSARRLYLDGTPRRRLEFLTPEDFWIRFLSIETSTPKFFTVEGDNLVFGPAPDDSFTGRFLYYKRFDSLVNAGNTNWILTNARGLLLYGALLEAEPYIKNDARLGMWASLYDELVDSVHRANKLDRYEAGAPLVVRSDVQVDPGIARGL